MKFWQLESICRWHGGSDLADELSDPRWGEFEIIYKEYNKLVQNQVREKLDKVVPLALAEAIFLKLSFRFSVNSGNLRLAPEGDVSGILAIDIARRYGGAVIEEVLEKGSVRV